MPLVLKFNLQIVDAALLDADDDFGFGETASFFTDMKKYNPTSGNDEDL